LPDDHTPDDEQLPDEEAQRIADALEALSPEEFARLVHFARYKMRGLQLRDAEPMDWVQEAIKRTLAGKRKWNHKRVSFFNHLKGCISSIANQCHRKTEKQVRLSERHESFATPGKKEANDVARDILKKVRRALRDDKLALRVLDLLEEGFSAALGRQILRMDANVYNAARKRIVRCIERLIRDE
jgi:hypothetical protein